jgi:tetraacyldisaccharide 4'-kinase
MITRWIRRQIYAEAPHPALLPLSYLYREGVRLYQHRATATDVGVPVLCVGNAVVGGAGKTPVVASIATHWAQAGIGVHCLSRGYGGQYQGPVQVDPAQHIAYDVGDEPLLLARHAPVWIGRDRVASARAAVAAGAERLLLDDGLQNPHLFKHRTLLVVDGASGFGNGAILPAGPLREPLPRAFARSHCVLLMGEDRCGIAAQIPPHLPLFRARVEAAPTIAATLKGKKLLAFAGIAHPQKFYRTLEHIGAELVGREDFPDHHRYTDTDFARLERRAFHLNAQLITTEKDAVRLSKSRQSQILTLPIRVVYEHEATFWEWVG